MITHHLDDILESLPHPLLLEGLYLPRTQYPRGIMTDGIEGVVDHLQIAVVPYAPLRFPAGMQAQTPGVPMHSIGVATEKIMAMTTIGIVVFP